MSTHSIVFTFDRDSVHMEAVCTAEPDADCRLVCTEDCETYSKIHRHEDTTFDGETVKRYTHDDCEASMKADECNVCLFLNVEHDLIAESAAGRPEFVIGRVPIEPTWEGDYYAWKPVTP